MAYYIMQHPQQYSPAYNEVIFVTSGTSNTAVNYNYICDIWFSGSTVYDIRVKAPVRPNGYGLFDLKFLSDYLTHDISIETSGNAGWKQNTNSYKAFDVHFGEEKGTSATITENILSSGTYFVFNGSLGFREFVDYDQNDYMSPTFSPSFYPHMLTNMPLVQNKIGSDENAWMYLMQRESKYWTNFQIETYDSTGTDIGRWEVANPYTAFTNHNNRFLRFPAGTRNVNRIPNSSFVDALMIQPIITSAVASYRVFCDHVIGLQTKSYYFEIDQQCTKNDVYRFHFLNVLGGFDSFSFIRDNRKSEVIDKRYYKRLAGNFSGSSLIYADSDIQKRAYSTSSVERIIIQSDWVKEDVYTWLYELISSPVVYWDDNDELVSVVITNQSYEYKQDGRDKVFNILLEVEMPYTKKRQSY